MKSCVNCQTRRSSPWAFAFCLLPVLASCKGPSNANIELRKQNAELREQVERLERAREGDQATIRALESQGNTVPRLPAERLAALFTTHGIALGRLSGGADTDPDSPGDEALRVLITPLDQSGQTLKAAGAVEVELFDLALPQDPRIGHWTFSSAEAMERWIGTGLISAYVFELPWQQQPAHTELTVKVTFTDELTGRVFTAQNVVAVAPGGGGGT